MKKFNTLLWVVALIIIGFAASESDAAELNPESEARIEDIRGLPVAEAYGRLSDVHFQHNPELMEVAVDEIFSTDPEKVVEIALNSLKKPNARFVEGQPVAINDHIYIARVVLHAYPEESVGRIVAMYESSDPMTRANILRSSGKLADYPAIRNLLLNALDDPTACESEDVQEVGLPMRLSDEAYNQLMLHHRLEGLPRTLGSSHSISARNQSIERMKKLLR